MSSQNSIEYYLHQDTSPSPLFSEKEAPFVIREVHFDCSFVSLSSKKSFILFTKKMYKFFNSKSPKNNCPIFNLLITVFQKRGEY